MPLRLGLLSGLLCLTGCFVTETELENALDRDRDGFLPVQTGGDDCNEGRADVNPAADEICGDGIDNDCDGVPDDDGVGARLWYLDADGDGFGVETESVSACTEPEGYAPVIGDCDDGDPAFNPAVEDLCDGRDQDCDGIADDEVPLVERYYDGDGDGFGTLATAILTCEDDADYVALVGDCDDTDPTISPAAIDLCDGIDQNCNGDIDENAVSYIQYRDADGDGFGRDDDSDVFCDALPGYSPVAGDCDDGDPTISPVAVDLCDAADQNCNGIFDEDAPIISYFYDADGDGVGDSDISLESCAPVSGYVLAGGDCDDTDPNISPLIPDVCDGIDQDCDGQIDDDAVVTLYFRDGDGDGSGDATDSVQDCAAPSGYVLGDGDCDDTDATIRPGAIDLCDAIDQDCDGALDEDATFAVWFEDADGDGVGTSAVAATTCDGPPATYVDVAGDCDDADPFLVIPTWYQDNDSDGRGGTASVQQCTPPSGYTSLGDDCDDADPLRTPGSTEICRTDIDEDCDASTDCLIPDATFIGGANPPPATIATAFDTPVGTDSIFAIGNVVGDATEDLLLVDFDTPWSQVVDGATLDFLDSANRIDGLHCSEQYTLDLVGSSHEDLVCYDPDAPGVFVYRGGATLSTSPYASYQGFFTTGFAPVNDGPLGVGIWFEWGTDTHFVPLVQDLGQDIPGSATATITGVSGDVQPVDCEPSMGGGCFLLSDYNVGIYVFSALGAGTHQETDAVLTFLPNPGDTLFAGGMTWDWTADGRIDLSMLRADATSGYLEYVPAPISASSQALLLELPADGPGWGGGIPAGDLDGDGLRDLISPFGSTILIRYTTDPNDPKVRSVASPIDVTVDQIASRDVDQDGYDDLLFQFRFIDTPGFYPPLFVLWGNGI